MKLVLSLCSALILAFGISSVVIAEPATTNAAPVVAADQKALININIADAQTLTQLKGIGLKKAEAIVAWREANGKFKTVEQLLDVKGIGEATLKANIDRISI